ncbi:hypothetical protein [Liquorilactobacillus mali]|uniref:Uncharacterized protein n=1 Tax=Liquorilactobacillus mali KCTC 3596 = DSM 20444 TaxID=1046596 RepID=A0A0R2E2Q7_9LACO|nr:hypothetical protein [Liquorilactobacillus mali]KRN09355.1 hypothetical protein FD00_GL001078 [Liquorilactobacillus mali KCTC 3596 = DSM 20444]
MVVATGTKDHKRVYVLMSKFHDCLGIYPTFEKAREAQGSTFTFIEQAIEYYVNGRRIVEVGNTATDWIKNEKIDN